MAEPATILQEEKGPSLNVRMLLLQYLKHWYWFILSIALTLGSAYLYLRYATPVYLINAAILVRDQPSSTSEKIIGRPEGDLRGSHIENEVELLKSLGLMSRVVDALNLTVRYYKQGKVGRDEEMYDTSPVWIYTGQLTSAAYQGPLLLNILNKQQYELQDNEGNSKGRYRFNQEVNCPYGRLRVLLKNPNYSEDSKLVIVVFNDREEIAKYYQTIFRVGSSLSSTILKLFIEDEIPSRGKAIINKILQFYTESALDDKNLESKYTIKFIDERLKLITGELTSVEHVVESYKNTQGITDLAGQANKYLDVTSTAGEKLNQINLDLQILNGVDNYLKDSQSGFAPAMLNLNDPVLTEQLQKLGALRTQHEKYSRTMQANNPLLQGITEQIQSTKVAVQENIAHQRQNLQLSRANLQRYNARSESSMRSIPRKERELISVKRQQSIKEELYLLLLRRKEEAAIAYASAITNSRIVDYASSTAFPLSPNMVNAYIVAFLMGLLIPAGSITLKSRLSNKVRSRSEIESETGLTVFGEIMKKPSLKKGAANGNVVGIETDRIIAEQFRLLRANLPYTVGNNSSTDNQVILVTSSISGEGKSFFSVNLSISLANLDKRVVLIESDLRKPKTTNYLGMSSDQVVGLTNYLSGQCQMRDLLRSTDHPNLYPISCGSIPPNPTELLSNSRTGNLFSELRQQFDYIILDTPPVSFVADTTLLAPHADRIFYLVRHDYTPRDCMQLLSGLSNKQRFKSLNIIFNGVTYDKSQQTEYGYYYKQAVS